LELLDRAAELVGTGAQLAEQAYVLDCDHGLIGEGRHERDLLVRERPYLLPIDPERADKAVLLAHADDQERADPAQVRGRAAVGIAAAIRILVADVDDMNEALSALDPPQGCAGP